MPNNAPLAPVRVTKRGLARKEQILRMASQKFLEHGYEGASVDGIIQEVGGSKTNVYSQFGNKEGLFRAVIESLCQEFLRNFKRLDLTGKDATTGLTALGTTLLKSLLQDKHIAFQRLVLAESGRFPGLGQTWFDDGPRQSRQRIAQFIEQCQHIGELRENDAQVAATLFHDMLVFNPTHLSTVARPLSQQAVRQHVRQVVELFMQGMASRK
jgi:TetR/AcrR family transcriptional regulator, mexJK operon transcriptional repressor